MDTTGLVQRARRGDRRAVERLLEAHQQRIYALAWHFLKDPQEAEEAAQDALLRVFTRLGDLQQPERFTSWALAIAANTCRDRLRARARRRSVALEEVPELEARGDGPAGQAEAGDLRSRLRRALDRLSLPLRRVVLLREVEGLSYEEVAAALDIPCGTVKSRLFEARRKLREILSASREMSCHEL